VQVDLFDEKGSTGPWMDCKSLHPGNAGKITPEYTDGYTGIGVKK